MIPRVPSQAQNNSNLLDHLGSLNQKLLYRIPVYRKPFPEHKNRNFLLNHFVVVLVA
jgi:hypothetical protein